MENNPTEFQKFCEGKDETEISEIRIASPDKDYAKAEQTLLENILDSETRNDWTEKDWEENLAQASRIYRNMASAMKTGLAPDADEVQTLVRQHHNHSKNFYTMSSQVYIAMAELYRQHPDFRLQLESVDPRLPEFMADAMVCFANHQ
ncbi:MAG: TipAS antibiotic-recognition domain-containing protein [Mariniblastus sp.]|nr:TipAS antibiotic-recognition domain-containing protein [Mariniblastus sp.]